MTTLSSFTSWLHWREQTRLIEDEVWARTDAFEKHFCHGEELIHLRLSSERFDVIYMTSEGQHIVDSHPIEDLIDFCTRTLS